MATLGARVQNLVGTVSSPTILDDWLTHGAKTIIDLVPKGEALKFAVDVTVPNGGVSAAEYRILYVSRDGRGATWIEPHMAAAAVDNTSMYFAVASHPLWTIDDGLVKLFPADGSARVFYGIAYPNVVNGDSAITGLATKYEHGVVLYASIHALQKQLSDLMRTSLDGASLSAPTPPSAPNAPTLTYVNASAATVSATTIGNLPAVAPAFTTLDLTNQLTLLGTYLDTEEDIELADAKIRELQTRLQEARGEFEEDLEEYRASVQKTMEQARITLQEALRNAEMTTDVNKQNAIYQFQASLQDYVQELALYDTKLKAYQADVQMAIQDFMAKIQKYTSEHDRILAQMQSLKEQYNQFLQLHFGANKPQ